MNTALINNLINLLLIGVGGLRQLGINYQAIIEAQQNAPGGVLTPEQRAAFIAQSRAAIDQL